MTDYWKDRRPPAERLPDCERLLESAQAEVDRLRAERDDALREVDQLMGKIAECRDAFGGVGLIEDLGLLHGAVGCPYEVPGYVREQVARLRAERDELLDALIPLANASMPDERALISDEDQERAAALVAKLENRTDD